MGRFQVFLNGIRMAYTDSSRECAQVEDRIMAELDSEGLEWTRTVSYNRMTKQCITTYEAA